MSEYDPLDLPAQELVKATKRRREHLERIDESGDVKLLMAKRWGRRMAWRLLDRAGVFRLSYVPRASDQTAFNEGNRNYGLHLLALIHAHCPETYLLMQKENAHDGGGSDADGGTNSSS